MREEVEHEIECIALEHAEHKALIEKELNVDKIRAVKIGKVKEELSYRSDRRQLIKVGHDFHD